jgi:hypothetical protein
MRLSRINFLVNTEIYKKVVMPIKDVKFLEGSNIGEVTCLLNLNDINGLVGIFWRFSLVRFFNFLENRGLNELNWSWVSLTANSGKILIFKFLSILYGHINNSLIFLNSKFLKYLPFSFLNQTNWNNIWYSVLLKLVNKPNFKLNLDNIFDLEFLMGLYDGQQSILVGKDELISMINGLINNPVDTLQYNQLNSWFLIDKKVYTVSDMITSYIAELFRSTVKLINNKELKIVKLSSYCRIVIKQLGGDVVETNFINLIEIYKAFNSYIVGLNIFEYKKKVSIVASVF